MNIGDVLAGTNIILAAIITLQSYRSWVRDRHTPWGWLRFAHICLGLLWVVISVYLFVTPEDIFQAQIGRVLARPAITFTLAIMAAGSIIGAKRT